MNLAPNHPIDLPVLLETRLLVQASSGGWRKPPGRPGVQKLRAKRKVRNRMAKISRRRNRAG